MASYSICPCVLLNLAKFSCNQFPDCIVIQLNDKVFPHLKISFHVNDWVRNSEIHFFMALIPYYEHVDKKRRVCCSYLVFVIHFRNHAAFNTLSRKGFTECSIMTDKKISIEYKDIRKKIVVLF